MDIASAQTRLVESIRRKSMLADELVKARKAVEDVTEKVEQAKREYESRLNELHAAVFGETVR